MKNEYLLKNYKVLNGSLILFYLFYAFLFYDQWLMLIPLFIIGTRGNITDLIINTSIIYFFCLFTNWFYLILLTFCFIFYLCVHRLISEFYDKENNYLLSTFVVTFLLFLLQSRNVLLMTGYIFTSISLVFFFDYLYKTYLSNREKESFFLEVVSIQLSADQKTNGDFFDTLETEDNQYLFLSDGMGSGKTALNISKFIVDKLKFLISKGFSLDESIKLCNKELTNKDVYASLDAVVCDKNEVYLFKKGAENSYLIGKKGIKKLNKYNLPMGIEDDNFFLQKCKVKNNDILILHSDGVTLSYPKFEKELYEKNNEEQLIKWIENLSIKSKEKVKDDFSIIMVKFNEKNSLS